jgi:hypothetical protein
VRGPFVGAAAPAGTFCRLTVLRGFEGGRPLPLAFAVVPATTLWIRFQPFDRLAPPLKMILSPAAAAMMRRAPVI